ncbi:DUF4386 domain-containing protein [Streptomyces fructofermentans]|uniref:DUF4386 domain-containing protein n=1 Tax=Streptomyces fructofermentans TaxID=152141 RepID=UPI00379FAC07
MTTTEGPATATRPRTDRTRNHVRAAGALYLVTFAASIPALLLIAPVLDHTDYITGDGADTRVLWGCLLDMVSALACVGTAVTVFPAVKRHSEALALGFVTSRLVEAGIILVGVVSLLSVVTLRQDLTGTTGAPGADTAALATTGQALVAVRDWTFLLGPGFMSGVNALLFGTLLYRSGLVPRFIPAMGLVGAPLLLASGIATFFGHHDQLSAWSFLATLPVAAWELAVGTWMLVKGFRPPAVTTEQA